MFQAVLKSKFPDLVRCCRGKKLLFLENHNKYRYISLHRKYSKRVFKDVIDESTKSILLESYCGITLIYTPILCTYMSLEYLLNVNLFSFYLSAATALPIIVYMKKKGVYFSTYQFQDDMKSVQTTLDFEKKKVLENEKAIEALNIKYQTIIEDRIFVDKQLNDLKNTLSEKNFALNASNIQYENLNKEIKNIETLNELTCKNYDIKITSFNDQNKKQLESIQLLETNIANCLHEKNQLILSINEANESLKSNLSELNNERSNNVSLKEQINYLSTIHEMQSEKFKSQVDVLNTNIASLQKQYVDKEHQVGTLQGKIEEKDEQLKQLKTLEFRLDNIFDQVGLVNENVGSLVENENKLQTSSKIGLSGENFVSKIICEITTSFEHTGQSKASKRGDFVISNFGNTKMNVMIEVKNDQNNVGGKNREKFMNDLDFIENDDIHSGIFISLMSNITNEEAYRIRYSAGGKPYLCIFNFARFDNISCCKHVLEACLNSLLFPFILQQESNYTPHEGKGLEEVYGRLKNLKILSLKNQGIKIKDLTQRFNDDIKDILSFIENTLKEK